MATRLGHLCVHLWPDGAYLVTTMAVTCHLSTCCVLGMAQTIFCSSQEPCKVGITVFITYSLAILEQPGGPWGAVIYGVAKAESVRLGAEGVPQPVREALSLLCVHTSTQQGVLIIK